MGECADKKFAPLFSSATVCEKVCTQTCPAASPPSLPIIHYLAYVLCCTYTLRKQRAKSERKEKEE